MRRAWWVVSLCLCGWALGVEAIPVQNPGFENGLAGWNSTSTSVLTTPGTIYGIQPRGNVQALLSSTGEGSFPSPTEVNVLLGTGFPTPPDNTPDTLITASALTQTVRVTDGVPLRLSFDWDFLTLEDPLHANAGRDGAFVSIDFTGDLIPEFVIFIAEIQPDSTDGGIGLTAVPMPEDPLVHPPYTFHTGYHTYMSDLFTPTGTTVTLGIGVADRFGNDPQAEGTGPSGILLDNIRLQGDPVAAIPEPGTLMLLGSGLLSVALWQRRIRHRKL